MFKIGDLVQNIHNRDEILQIKKIVKRGNIRRYGNHRWLNRNVNHFIDENGRWHECRDYKKMKEEAIHCKTLKEYSAVIKILTQEKDHQWSDKTQQIKQINWKMHREETCIINRQNIEFSCIDYFKERKIKITTAKKYIQNDKQNPIKYATENFTPNYLWI